MTNMIIVMVPLMIAAGIFTHITARHSVARQVASGQGMDNPQTAIMQKLMLYVFPIGVVVGAPFLPLAILIYWVSNNLWTLGQQYVVYRRIDAEQAEKKEQAAANRQALAPRPGQKPVRPERADARARDEPPAEEARREAGRCASRRPRSTNTSANRRRAPRPTGRRAATQRHERHGEERRPRHGRSGQPQGAGATPSARRPRKRR